MYEDFIKSSPKCHFMQSDAWARVKDNWIHERAVVERDGDVRGYMSILIRKMPLGGALMYSPRGPVCDVHDRDTLKALMDEAERIAKKYNAYAFKLDPDVPSSDTAFAESMQSLGFKLNDTGKDFEGIQPRYVFRLHIEGKTADEVFGGFASKWRYNIRLAERSGVHITLGTRDDIEAFHAIMRETGDRDGFIIRTPDYFTKMFDELGEHLRLYLAHYNGQLIGGTIAIAYGDKVWYLYGASSNAHRNVMPNYLLQWAMIRWAVELGCRVYDFRGVSGDTSPENPLYGLFRFKKGFGGEFTEFVGELEKTYRPAYATLLNTAIKTFMKLRQLGVRRRGAVNTANTSNTSSDNTSSNTLNG